MPHVKDWPLLNTAVQHIIDHPEEWDQSEWVSNCGTKACVAGWVVHSAGHSFAPAMTYKGFTAYVYMSTQVGIRLRHVADLAEELLGLTVWESQNLFSGGNSLWGILSLLTKWADDDDVELPQSFRDHMQLELDIKNMPDSVETLALPEEVKVSLVNSL